MSAGRRQHQEQEQEEQLQPAPHWQPLHTQLAWPDWRSTDLDRLSSGLLCLIACLPTRACVASRLFLLLLLLDCLVNAIGGCENE